MAALPPLASDDETTCLIAFIPRNPDPYPLCTCDESLGHQGKHHCPDCDVWWSLASEGDGRAGHGSVAPARLSR